MTVSVTGYGGDQATVTTQDSYSIDVKLYYRDDLCGELTGSDGFKYSRAFTSVYADDVYVDDGAYFFDDDGSGSFTAHFFTNEQLAEMFGGGDIAVTSYQNESVQITLSLPSDLNDAEKALLYVDFGFSYDDVQNTPVRQSKSGRLTYSSPGSATYDDVNAVEPNAALTVTTLFPSTGFAAQVDGYTVNVTRVSASVPLSAKVVMPSGYTSPVNVTVSVNGSARPPVAVAPGAAVSLGVSREEGKTYSVTAAEVTGLQYTVSETGGVYTITYTAAPETVTYNGTVVWSPSEPSGRGSITVTLSNKDTGVATGTATLAAGDNEFHFAAVPKYNANGSLAVYGVTVGRGNIDYHYDLSTVTDSAARTITVYFSRTVQPDAFNLTVNVVWKDSNNKYGKRPAESYVKVFCNGAWVTGGWMSFRAADDWTAVLKDLDGDYRNSWTVKGVGVTGYYTDEVSVVDGTATVVYTYGLRPPSCQWWWNTNAGGKLLQLDDPLLTGSLTAAQRAAYEREVQLAAAEYASLSELAHSGGAIDFAALRALNGNTAGWISSGSGIDYPILRGGDNDYYQSHGFDGGSSCAGAIFMDSNCNSAFQSKNTVIFGKNIGSASMFGSLVDYSDQSYFDQHQSMLLQTPAGDYDIEIFAAFTAGDEYTDVSRRTFNGEDDFMSYVRSCSAKSDVDSTVEVNASDSIITLVTGTNNNDGTLYVVMGRLVKR